MILGVIQARMGSSRLPGKALLDVAGKPLLAHAIERLRRVATLDKIIVATGQDARNEPIRDLARSYGLDCFSGSEDDVLDRFYQAALPHRPDAVVRVTGDCPLVDPDVVDRLVALFLKETPAGIAGTGPTFPEGLDAEVVAWTALEAARREATLRSEREHVTAWIWKNAARFPQKRLECTRDLSWIRVTCDEPKDLEVLRIVLGHFTDGRPSGVDALAGYFDAHPEVTLLNSHIPRNEGYKISLDKD